MIVTPLLQNAHLVDIRHLRIIEDDAGDPVFNLWRCGYTNESGHIVIAHSKSNTNHHKGNQNAGHAIQQLEARKSGHQDGEHRQRTTACGHQIFIKD
ncbi:hypothetical protein D3C75_756810 [compost metagenome]